MVEQSVAKFVEVLGSKEPVPGGGGAAALAGALGAALGAMAASLTVGKKKFAHAEGELRTAIEELNGISKRYLELAEEDAKAFLPLSKVYGMPKGTDEEQKARAAAMEEALNVAIQPPYNMVRLCRQCTDVLERIERNISALVISDLGCAASLTIACVDCAVLNVFVNAKMMADEAASMRIMDETRAICADVRERMGRVYRKVEGDLCRKY